MEDHPAQGQSAAHRSSGKDARKADLHDNDPGQLVQVCSQCRVPGQGGAHHPQHIHPGNLQIAHAGRQTDGQQQGQGQQADHDSAVLSQSHGQTVGFFIEHGRSVFIWPKQKPSKPVRRFEGLHPVYLALDYMNDQESFSRKDSSAPSARQVFWLPPRSAPSHTGIPEQWHVAQRCPSIGMEGRRLQRRTAPGFHGIPY